MVNNELLRQNGLSGYFYRILFIILIPIAQCIYFLINLTTTSATDITKPLDYLIPFNEWFVIPYVFWYVYTFGALLIMAYYDHKTYFKLLFSILVGMAICFVIYYIYPTTVPRPEIMPDNILKKAVLVIYSNDKPYNCFPSIHMLDTLLITLFVLKNRSSLLLKVSVSSICILIYLSTFFVKQHSLLDAAASTILGTVLFLFFESGSIADRLWNRNKIQVSVNEDI